jgi:hypothetical protein
VTALEGVLNDEVACDQDHFRDLTCQLFAAADQLVENAEDLERWKRKWLGGTDGG